MQIFLLLLGNSYEIQEVKKLAVLESKKLECPLEKGDLKVLI